MRKLRTRILAGAAVTAKTGTRLSVTQPRSSG